MGGQAQIVMTGGGRDPASLEAASAELWTGLNLNDDARASLRRDGLDLAQLRLAGPHPFIFASSAEGTILVSARAADESTAERLLDLFRIYFLRRLTPD